MKVRSLLAFTLALFVTTPFANAANPACSRFHAGHYVRVADSTANNWDGLGTMDWVLARDLRSFQGVVYQINWGMIETAKGAYNFSRIDAALAKAKAKGKYLFVKLMDRTYSTGCNSAFLPSYVARESDGGSRFCAAKIWESATMDNEIRVLQQLQMRYKNDPSFLGITTEETSISPLSFKANISLTLSEYDQLKRMHTAVHSVAPNLIINQYLNWPLWSNSYFYAIGDNLIAMGGGGGIGWPDTTPSQEYDMTKGGSWYQVARDRRTKMLIMAGTEGGGNPDYSYATTEKVYNMLVNDINAHAIIWDIWASPYGNGYFTDIVIPLLNKYGGKVRNTACPW
jgi:hypothetical protein